MFLSILIFVQLIHSKFCVQSDKRKGALLEKDPSKKARLEPDDIVFETADQEGGASSTPQVDTNNEKCANCNLSVTTPKVRSRIKLNPVSIHRVPYGLYSVLSLYAKTKNAKSTCKNAIRN